MNLEQARFNMIEQQIRPWNVADAGVLQLLSIIRREDFVPLAHKALAFANMEIPLQGHPDDARAKGQVMLAPHVQARLLQDVALRRHEKVLEIGTGSGFMAALLAHRAQRVVTLEIDPALARQARINLQRAGIHNAEVREADGAGPAQPEGPFDVIVLSGSVAEVPAALLAQLKTGGRLAAIVGHEPVMRATVVTRTDKSTYTTAQPWDTVAPRLRGFAEASAFVF